MTTSITHPRPRTIVRGSLASVLTSCGITLFTATMALPVLAMPAPGTQDAATEPREAPRRASARLDQLDLVRLDSALDPITLDGRLDEAVWTRIRPVTDFVVIEPDTLERPELRTEIRFAYTDDGLYVGARLEQPADTLIERLSGRDSFTTNRDSVNLTLDTSGEGRYGYWFGVNLGDSLMDGTVLPERKFSNEWDGPWIGRSQRTETGWSAELYIPWSILTMPAGGDPRHMGVYVSRKVAFRDERWAWPALPPTRPRFMSALQDVAMTAVQPRQQVNFYPFVAESYDRIEGDFSTRIGADVFWRPSTNFQLLATLNPDFGSVESDEAVVNLSATEVFFPEKRLFFLEGQEVFFASPRADTRGQGVGNSGAPYTMVNTRRIGGQPRAPTPPDEVELHDRELVRPVDLFGAVKTTGQFGRIRYGVMGAFEQDAEFTGTRPDGTRVAFTEPGSNYGIARIAYEDAGGGGYRAVGLLSTAVLHQDGDAIVHGADAHYLSPGGRLKLDGQFMHSDVAALGSGFGGFLDAEITWRRGLVSRGGVESFDRTFDINDLGFLSRRDHRQIRSSLIWTKSDLDWARENQLDIRGFWQMNNSQDVKTGAAVFVSDRLRLKDLSEITARISWFPAAYDDLNSFGNGTYRIADRPEASLLWSSDSSQRLQTTFGLGMRTEQLGGTTLTSEAALNWRPSDRMALNLRLRYWDRAGWLLHQGADLMTTFDADQWMPSFSFDYFFSARQQFRVSLQWVGISAEERDFYRIPDRPGALLATPKPTGAGARSRYDFSVSQYTIQARYRWELAPLSDLFIVYTRLADRGAGLGDDDISDIFTGAWNDPLVDLFVVKLRYRLGT